MEPLYSYKAYKDHILVFTDVQQKTSTEMERREYIVSPWSSMFFVSVFCFPFHAHTLVILLLLESYVPM